jgi:3-oxoacyl-[acyl-carrier-protein] synthase-3
MSLALLGQAGLGLDDVTWFVPHQANARIISAAAKRLGVDESRFFVDIEDYANTSAASIPIAICDMQSRGLLKRGDLVVSVGFGAGLTSGGILFRW